MRSFVLVLTLLSLLCVKPRAQDFLASDSSFVNNFFEDSNLEQPDNNRFITDTSTYDDWLTEGQDAGFGDLFASAEPASDFMLASECGRGGKVNKFRARDSESTSCSNRQPDGEGLMIPGLIPLTGEFQPEAICVAPYAWHLCCSQGPLLDPSLGWDTILPWLKGCYINLLPYPCPTKFDACCATFDEGTETGYQCLCNRPPNTSLMLLPQDLSPP